MTTFYYFFGSDILVSIRARIVPKKPSFCGCDLFLFSVALNSLCRARVLVAKLPLYDALSTWPRVLEPLRRCCVGLPGISSLAPGIDTKKLSYGIQKGVYFFLRGYKGGCALSPGRAIPLFLYYQARSMFPGLKDFSRFSSTLTYLSLSCSGYENIKP